MKRTLYKRAGAALAALAAGAATAAAPISVTVGGSPIEFSGQQPVKRGERVLVPLRGVFEKLGATVNYDESARTVTAKDGQTDVQLTVGSRRALVDGKPITLDTPVRERRGSVLVPLRFVSENLGAQVDYDKTSGVVALKPGAPRQANQQGGAAPTAPTSPSQSSPAQSSPASGGMTSAPNTGVGGQGMNGASGTSNVTPPVTTPPTTSSTNGTSATAPTGTAPGGMTTSPDTSISTPSTTTPSTIGTTPSGSMASPPGPAGATPVTPPADATTAAAPPERTRPSMPPPVVTDTTDTTDTATPNYLPWILGAVVLLGVIGFLLNRRGKTGQVIASNDGKK